MGVILELHICEITFAGSAWRTIVSRTNAAMAESITDLLKRDIRNWMFKMVKKSFSTWWHLLVRAGGSHCQSRTFGKIWGLECDDHGDHAHDGDDVEDGDEDDQFSLSWRMRGTVLVSSPHLCLCLFVMITLIPSMSKWGKFSILMYLCLDRLMITITYWPTWPFGDCQALHASR